jgi:lipoyl(octanoyl) transferase
MLDSTQPLIVKKLGLQDYETVWQNMKQFSLSRIESTPDELWFVEHPPIFTMGLNGKSEHVIDPGTIPVVNVDRGGQVTYHGPGQMVIYTLIDLKRLDIGIRAFVLRLEQTIINLLATYNISSNARADAPGVYVNHAKIAALGLRVKCNHVYHGASLNIDMDLEPFSRINPCGYEDMAVTQLIDLAGYQDMDEISQKFTGYFTSIMGYNNDS